VSAKTPAQLKAELADLNEVHDDLLNEIFENAGDADLFGDSGPEDLALAYVRRLEAEAAEAARLRELVADIIDHPGLARVSPASKASWRKRAERRAA
jgi:hypothetical protein